MKKTINFILILFLTFSSAYSMVMRTIPEIVDLCNEGIQKMESIKTELSEKNLSQYSLEQDIIATKQRNEIQAERDLLQEESGYIYLKICEMNGLKREWKKEHDYGFVLDAHGYGKEARNWNEKFNSLKRQLKSLSQHIEKCISVRKQLLK